MSNQQEAKSVSTTSEDQPTEASKTEETQTERKIFRLSDDVIAMVRELVQLSLLTGTNIVDHLRSVVVEASPEDGRFITLCPEYIEAYNRQVEALAKEADARMNELQNQLAEEAEVVSAGSQKPVKSSN